ncbi:MAG: hypothetical protein COA78_11180 [Blastopirellula sp.]|nr:MAG: hypothetical protein COA78_11180 [Blastopirellula sp.]
MVHQNEKLIDTKRAAEILGGSEQYVRMLIQNDELQGAKLGGRYYTSKEAIQRAVFGHDSAPSVILPSPPGPIDSSVSATALADFK